MATEVRGPGGLLVRGIVDPVHRQVEVHTDPSPTGYGSSEIFPDGQSVTVAIDGSDRPGPGRGRQKRLFRSVRSSVEAVDVRIGVHPPVDASVPISPVIGGSLPPRSSPSQPPGPHRSDSRRSPRLWTRTIIASFTESGDHGMLPGRRIRRERCGDGTAAFPGRVRKLLGNSVFRVILPHDPLSRVVGRWPGRISVAGPSGRTRATGPSEPTSRGALRNSICCNEPGGGPSSATSSSRPH